MIAVRTLFVEDELREQGPLSVLRESIERAVPLSAGKNNAAVTATAAPRVSELEERARERSRRARQPWD